MSAIFEGRCPLCDWPLKPTIEEGCALGSCSYRPSDDSNEAARMDRRRIVIRGEIAALTTALEKGGQAIAASRDTGASIAAATLAFMRAVHERNILRSYVEGTNA